MLRNISQLEVQVNNRIIRLQTDMDAETFVVREALNQFLKFIDQIEEAHKAYHAEKANQEEKEG